MRNSSGQPLGTVTCSHVPMGVGGQVIKLHIAANGDKIVCCDIYGAYRKRSTDSKFVNLFTNAPAGLIPNDHSSVSYNDSQGCVDAVYAPSDSSNIWMVFDGHLCLSTDGGATFTAMSITPSVMKSNGHDQKSWGGHQITVDPTNPSVVLFGTHGNGVYYSTNKGSTWTSLSVAAGNTSPGGYASPHWTACDPSSSVAGTPSQKQKWYYIRYGVGIYESTTGVAGPYTLMTNTPTNVTWFHIDAAGNKWALTYGVTENLWKCPTGSSTWSNLNTSTGQSFGKVVVDPNNTNVVLLMWNLGSYKRSRDGGSTWVDTWNANLGNNPPETVNRQPDIKYLDIGPTKQYNVVPNHPQFDPSVANRLWAATWIDVVQCDMPATGGGSANRLTFFGAGKGIEEAVCHTVHVNANGKAYAGDWDLGAFRIDDLTRYVNPQVCAYLGTDTWASGLLHPPRVSPCSSIKSASDNPNWVVFMEHGGWGDPPITYPRIGLSTDGGLTLNPFPTAPLGHPYSNGGGSLAVGRQGQVVILWPNNVRGVSTQDGGVTWNYLNIAGSIDGDSGFGVDGSGYFLAKHSVTYDATGGAFYLFNWGTSQGSNPIGFWKSTDGGLTWTHQSTTWPDANWGNGVAVQFKAVPGVAGYIYATNGNGTTNFTGRIYRSSNSAVSWGTPVTTNAGQAIANCTALGFGKPAPGRTNATIFYWATVNGVTGLFRSDDDMVTSYLMTQFPDGSTTTPLYIDGDPSKYGRCYLSMNGHGLIVCDYTFTLTCAA